MKKYTLLPMVLSIILAFGNIISAHADILPAKGEGQIGYQAVVLCENLTVRQERSSSSKAVKTLHYGDMFTVQDACGHSQYVQPG